MGDMQITNSKVGDVNIRNVSERKNFLIENKKAEGLLLQYIKEDDDIELKYLLEEGGVNVNYGYPEFGYKNALQIACLYYSSEINGKCVKLLLEYRLDVMYKDPETGKNCLHFAAESKNCQILKTILDYIKKTDSIDISNSNVIYKLIEYIRRNNEKEEEYENILELLLNTKISINYEERDTGRTAIYLAAKYKYMSLIQKMIKEKGKEIDLDEFKDNEKKSARDLIIETNLYRGNLPKLEEYITITISTLYKNIRQRLERNFIENYTLIQNSTESKNSLTNSNKLSLLDMAVKFRMEQIVKFLLEKDIKNDLKKDNNPLIIACQRGYHKIVKLFIIKQMFNESQIEKAIFELLKFPYFTQQQSDDVNYRKCISYLKNEKDCDFYNIALHYALKYQEPEMALEYLQKGAKLISKNSSGRLAIEQIDSNTLEQHLNKCIQYEEKFKTHQDSCLIVHFSSILPIKNNHLHTQQETNNQLCNEIDNAPTETSRNENHEFNNEDEIGLAILESNISNQASSTVDISRIQQEDNNHQSNIAYDDAPAGTSNTQHYEFDGEDGTEKDIFIPTGGKEYLPETEVIQNMCIDDLRTNLKHPVILIFLFLKWERVKIFFVINFCIYFLFGILLLAVIYSKLLFFNYILVIILFYIICREIFQIVIYTVDYFKSVENWIEIALISSTIGILLEYSNEKLMPQFSAVAIVTAATEFLLLIGKFWFKSYIVMLRTVSSVFLKLFILYSVLLFAFACSFNILFQETKIENISNSNDTETKIIFNCTNTTTEIDFFENIGLSLFKTFIMLTGEFEASNLKFNSYNFVSYALFVIFVFVIAIVLYNLFNGLAVSDTHMIKNDAELYGLIMRVELIVQIEKILLLCLKVMNSVYLPRKLSFLIKEYIYSTNFENSEIKIYPNLEWKVNFTDANDIIIMPKKLKIEMMGLMRRLRLETKRLKQEAKIIQEINELREEVRNIKQQSLIISNSKVESINMRSSFSPIYQPSLNSIQ